MVLRNPRDLQVHGRADLRAGSSIKAHGIAYDRTGRYAAEREDGDLLFSLDRDEKKLPEGV